MGASLLRWRWAGGWSLAWGVEGGGEPRSALRPVQHVASVTMWVSSFQIYIFPLSSEISFVPVLPLFGNLVLLSVTSPVLWRKRILARGWRLSVTPSVILPKGRCTCSDFCVECRLSHICMSLLKCYLVPEAFPDRSVQIRPVCPHPSYLDLFFPNLLLWKFTSMQEK